MGWLWHDNVPEDKLDQIVDIHKDIGGQGLEVEQSKQVKGAYNVSSLIVDQVPDKEQPIIPTYIKKD